MFDHHPSLRNQEQSGKRGWKSHTLRQQPTPRREVHYLTQPISDSFSESQGHRPRLSGLASRGSALFCLTIPAFEPAHSAPCSTVQCLAEIGPAAAFARHTPPTGPLEASCISSRFCRLHSARLTDPDIERPIDESRFELIHHLGLVSPDNHDLIFQDLSLPPFPLYSLLSMPPS